MRKLTIFIMCMVFAFNVMAQDLGNNLTSVKEKKEMKQNKLEYLIRRKVKLEEEISKIDLVIDSLTVELSK